MSGEDIKLGPQTDLSIFAETMVEMTWVDVMKSAENRDIVLLPIGIIEAHGPHMDLSPDVYLGYLFCKYLRQNLKYKGIQSIIAPPFYWGVSNDVKKYPGTFSVRPETMKSLLVDVFSGLDSWGFKNVFIVNAHGDPTHVQMIDEAIHVIQAGTGLQVYNLGNLDVQVENPPVFPPPREGRFEPDYHAGANETAAMHTFYPQKVNEKIAETLTPHNTFDPLAYCGDPAGFRREATVIEYYQADLEMDSLKIEAVLKGKQR